MRVSCPPLPSEMEVATLFTFTANIQGQNKTPSLLNPVNGETADEFMSEQIVSALILWPRRMCNGRPESAMRI